MLTAWNWCRNKPVDAAETIDRLREALKAARPYVAMDADNIGSEGAPAEVLNQIDAALKE